MESCAGFFVANFMKKQLKNKDITIDSIAEQWARLILSQIEAKKEKHSPSQSREVEDVN